MKNKIKKLIEKLKSQLDYLCSIKIRGMTKEDVRQELILYILETTKEHPEYLGDKYKIGWWFKRLKWYILNKIVVENREPVNRSIRLGNFNL